MARHPCWHIHHNEFEGFGDDIRDIREFFADRNDSEERHAECTTIEVRVNNVETMEAIETYRIRLAAGEYQVSARLFRGAFLLDASQFELVNILVSSAKRSWGVQQVKQFGYRLPLEYQ
jgi:hypothetical protein